MSFPLSPNDGDTFLTSLGVLYKYDASRLSWLIQSGVSGGVGPGTINTVPVFVYPGTAIGDSTAATGVLFGGHNNIIISCADASSDIILEIRDPSNAAHALTLTADSASEVVLTSDESLRIQTNASNNTSIALSPQDSDDANHDIVLTADSGNNVYIGTINSDKLWLQSNSSGDALTINNLGSLSSINLNGATVTISGSALNFNATPVVVEQYPLTDWPSSSATPVGVTVSVFNATYKVIDNLCHLWFTISGTSTSAAMSFTLPFTAKHTGTYAQAVEFATVAVVDNSSVTGTPGLAVVNVSGTPAVDLYKTSNSNGTWTASNAKQCAGYLVYQVQ